MNDYVTLLITLLTTEMNKKIRNGVYGYTQRNMAYNSNKIEGSTLSKEQTTSLFETQTLKSDKEFVRVKDVEETTGHFIMFNNMLETITDELSEELIKKYHYALKSGVFEDKANGFPIGEYKNRANIVNDIKTTLPANVPMEMSKLLKEYNSKENISLKDITELHVKFKRIHPFQDGNGRTGRVIIFKECLKNNIMPFIIEDEFKPIYYENLKEAQINNNYEPLVKFFESEQRRYFDEIIDLIEEKH